MRSDQRKPDDESPLFFGLDSDVVPRGGRRGAGIGAKRVGARARAATFASGSSLAGSSTCIVMIHSDES